MLGADAGQASTTAFQNVFIGEDAGFTNVGGDTNVFIGSDSGYLSTGDGNTYVGKNSGESMTTGSENTFIGSYNGNQDGLDLRTASNNIVLADGDGVPYFFANSAGFEAGGTPARQTSTSIHMTINRGAGNTSETFTSAQMGMSDNCTVMIFISIGGNTTSYAFGSCVISWYMPRGANSVINSDVVTLYKGSGVSSFARAVSGNSLVITKDSGLPVSVQVIGGGGTTDPN